MLRARNFKGLTASPARNPDARGRDRRKRQHSSPGHPPSVRVL